MHATEYDIACNGEKSDHRTDTRGLMRRMVKEELLTFEGKPLFPERRAYTVEYELSDPERELCELVTGYVRTEMGRAERLAQAGDKKRGNNVGFALTVLQRRLASSPEAILRSLERRQVRLEARLREWQRATDEAVAAKSMRLSMAWAERSRTSFTGRPGSGSAPPRAHKRV